MGVVAGDGEIAVDHQPGGPIAALYAARHPAAGVVSVDAPIRLEPFAEMLQALRPQLVGDGFLPVWERFRESFGLGLLTPTERELLRAGERPSQQVFLSYQADLLERPLEDAVRWRDDAMRTLGDARTPYLSLHASPVDEASRAWLSARVPQATIDIWPVGHHFPHLADPQRFAEVITRLAGCM